MGGARRHHRLSFRLTPLGSILAVALIVFAVLAIVHPTAGAYLGLIAVVLIWGVSLGMSFPSGQARGTYHGPEAGRTDYGAEAADEYERQSD